MSDIKRYENKIQNFVKRVEDADDSLHKGSMVFLTYKESKDHLKAIDELKQKNRNCGERHKALTFQLEDCSKLSTEQFYQIEELKAEVEYCHSARKQSDHVIRSLEAEVERLRGGWISVDDRLPNERQQVLTCDVYDRIYHCTYIKYNFKLKFHCDDHSKVTHWQPLPQPPS